MGWLFSERWQTRESLRKHLVSGNGVKTLKSCWVGNNLWAVQESTYTQGEKTGQTVRFVCLYLCAKHGKGLDGWGYKDVDESAGPCQTTCPVSYIEMVEDWEREHGQKPVGYAAEWRERVREAHTKVVLTEGQEIMLYDLEYVVVSKKKGGCYWIKLKSTASLFHLPRRMLKHVLVATQNPGG